MTTVTVTISARRAPLPPSTQHLLDQMSGTFSGISQSLGVVARGRDSPRVCVIGGEMTGVHRLAGTRAPSAGAYHIGGAGLTYGDAVIRALGETVERYASFLKPVIESSDLRRISYAELKAADDRVLTPPNLNWFLPDQLHMPGFPCTALSPDVSTGWVSARSLISGERCWVTAQEAYPGYVGQKGEPRFIYGVSTGTAAHTRLDHALRNALLELVQIDAAMGHWYGADSHAVPIGRSDRTQVVDRIIDRHVPPSADRPRMYWLPSPDLPGFAVACLIESPIAPRVGVGLGCDLNLEDAMIKAFLEATAVAQLAKVILFRMTAEGQVPRSTGLYDLDENVGFYAADDRELLRVKFPVGATVKSDQLPPDRGHTPQADIEELIGCFSRSAKELVLLDLTTPDVADLGFVAVRTWSPDLLTLSLPSAPPLAHARFDAYGGAADVGPHPYP